MKPVAVAGHAMIAPGLLNVDDIMNGVSAVESLDASMPVPMGAPVPLNPIAPESWPYRLFPRAIGLAIHAAQRLQRDPQRRYGLVLGMPNLFSETDYMEHTLQYRDDGDQIAAVQGFAHDMALNFLAGFLNIQGPRLRVDSACATGNDALIVAHQWLSAGLVDDVLVLAASAMLNPVGLALFNNLQALNDSDDPWASCPFDRRRRGFVMGEGAAAMWLTNHPPHTPEGFLCGYGQSLNAENFVDLPQDSGAMLGACRQALGGLGEVAWVCAHGTATPANDPAETRLYHELFGKRAPHIPISSIKSMIGHCLGAAALIEAIVGLEALKRGVAPPTINLEQPDPECDLDYIPGQARKIEGQYALSNAFAFGGQNACILLSGALP